MGQLSFFSADARARALTDLEGVLCGRGQAVMFGRGTTARLSMVLGAPPPPPPVEAEEAEETPIAPPWLPEPDPVAEWRARALWCAFRARGVDAELDRAPDGRPVVRSAFRADLVDVARRWTRGAVKAVPPDVELDGSRLRLWVLAAGRQAGRAYLLGLDPHAEQTHEPLLTASRRAGLGATLGGDRADPVLRIVGHRRQGRLGELVGRPPRDLVPGIWPG